MLFRAAVWKFGVQVSPSQSESRAFRFSLLGSCTSRPALQPGSPHPTSGSAGHALSTVGAWQPRPCARPGGLGWGEGSLPAWRPLEDPEAEEIPRSRQGGRPRSQVPKPGAWGALWMEGAWPAGGVTK